MAEELKFQHPFTLIIAGPTSSGKTSFCLKFLQHLKSLCSETSFAGGIIWCYSEKTAVPRQQLQNLHENVFYHEGVPEEFGDAQEGRV
jgi:Ni2+-binding GTPase involved in maturation of urease and hydrogenase